jgi:hypothetical protein
MKLRLAAAVVAAWTLGLAAHARPPGALATGPAAAQAEKSGFVVSIDSRCDYFIVDAPLGYVLVEWFGGSVPNVGDVLVGDLESFGFKWLRNRSAGNAVRVWVDDYWMSRDRATERYLDHCGWRLR